MHVSVAYSSVIISRGGVTRSREELSKGEAPVVDGDSIRWNAPRLGLEVSLQRRVAAHSETLADGVEWRCLAPSAAAVFSIEGEGEIRGDGYAEILELDVAPWNLPIDELRWGRFASAGRAITWIDWRGPHPLTRVFVDGVEVSGARVGDDHVDVSDLTLTFDRARLIRDDTIGQTLGSLKALLPLLPARIAAARETKWCGRGVVHDKTAATDCTGWVIHELVRFR